MKKILVSLICVVYSAQGWATVSAASLCEALLSVDLEADAAHSSDLLYSLRTLSGELSRRISVEDLDSTRYGNVYSKADLNAISSGQALKLYQQLKGLEDGLTRPNLDMQMFAIHFRGANDIVSAFMKIHKGYEDARREYRKVEPLLKERFPEMVRLRDRVRNMNLALFLAINTVFATHVGVGEPNVLSSLPTLIYDGVASVSFIGGLFASGHATMKMIASDVLAMAKYKPDGRSPVVMYSEEMEMPIEFHRALFGDAKVDPEDRDLGRMKFYLRNTTLSNGFAFLLGGLENDPVEMARRAGDTFRRAYVDHILYFDTERNEPVWVLSYRAYRKIPSGRKPRKTSAETLEQSSPVGIPGLIRPLGAH